MIVVGIDLSGPSNHADTAVVWARCNGARLDYMGSLQNASDRLILDTVSTLGENDACTLGIDAPLSYNDGGGFRAADANLQAAIIALGMQPGSVMAPTLTHMSYLTLRGHGLSRAIGLLQCNHDLSVVETHPGAVFGLHGAPLIHVLDYKTNAGSRVQLLNWLGTRKVIGLPANLANSSHLTAACGAAYGAWHWSNGTSIWSSAKTPQQHPFDFSC